jgi:hypothetical protein
VFVADSLQARLAEGELAEWCSEWLAGADAVAAELAAQTAAAGEHERRIGRALALRLGALVQPAPPYRALHGLVNSGVVARQWADEEVSRYRTHADLLFPFRRKALDMRPTAESWLDLDPTLNRGPFGSVLELATPAPAKHDPLPAEPVMSELFDRIRQYFTAHAVPGEIGSPGAEAGLARLCWLLALFEEGRPDVLGTGSPSVERLHATAPDPVVQELVTLTGRLADVTLRRLRESAGNPPAGQVSGIAAPALVDRWADADLLIGGPDGNTLLDVRTAGDAAQVRRWLWHLLACAWLDVEDCYRIRTVGLSVVRRDRLVTWPVTELAELLLQGRDPETARGEFRALAQRVLTSVRLGLPRRNDNAVSHHRRVCVIEETEMPQPDVDDPGYWLDTDDDEPRPGWSVTPGGPVCPSRELAELALRGVAQLPDGWTLTYVEDPYDQIRPYWELFKRRRGGHHRYNSNDADADGLAWLVFMACTQERIAEQKAAEPPKKKTTRAAPARPTVYGPESWSTMAGADWTYWDLWFCLVCVAEHGGDWAGLDTALSESSPWVVKGSEARWWHLVDLRKRLAAAGLSAADLVAEVRTDRKALTKAHDKVIEQTGVRHKHLSPAMRDTPTRRLKDRAHFGSWDRYPTSPRNAYDQIAAAVPFDLEAGGWGLPTDGNIDPLFRTVELLEQESTHDLPSLLAVRRAALTATSLAYHRCDNSYGDLGMEACDVLIRFSQTNWPDSGIAPEVFWRDFVEIFGVLGNFAAGYEHEAEIVQNLGAQDYADLLDKILTDLHARYLEERLTYEAEELRRIGGYAGLAD